ncbi:MAG TPA: alpha-L-fucosidase [Candidatus Acidoferrum sp.]|nr:alpha-L-fucosidase [Candidatus Acidoferrum sp.]
MSAILELALPGTLLQHGDNVKRVPVLLFLLCFSATTISAQKYRPAWDSIDQRPTPEWFTEARFGIFIHWGTYSVPAYAPVIPGKLAYAEWYWHAMTNGRNDSKANDLERGTWAFHQKLYGADFLYQNFASQFKAELFDPDHWADVFARSGAKYVVLTSKHHEGFALWPSKEASAVWGRPWNAVEIGPMQDLLAGLTDAVRRKGLRMGYYYSLYEWYNPLWLCNKPLYVTEHMFPQFKDLVTHYKPSVIFSDGEWEMSSADWHSPELLAWLFNDSPVKDEVVVNDRWGSDTRHKHGGYWTTEYTAGMSGTSHPWEENRGMGVSYGYNRAENLSVYHTGRELVFILVDTVSRGGNLLLDIGPGADGTIPVIMEQRLNEIGDWMKINGEAIYGTKPWKTTRQWTAGEVPKIEYNKEYSSEYDVTKLIEKPAGGRASIEAFFTAKGNDLYAILPHWSGHSFVIKDLSAARLVALLGSPTLVKFKATKSGVAIELPDLPDDLRAQPAWVLRITLN